MKDQPAPVLTLRDSDMTIRVPVGARFAVELPENPTTGYRWKLECTDSCRMLGSAFTAGSGVGSAGKRIFELVIDVPGEHGVRAALRRPWEPPERAIERFAAQLVAYAP